MKTFLGALALVAGVLLVLLGCAFWSGHQRGKSVAFIVLGLGALWISYQLLWKDDEPSRPDLLDVLSLFDD